MTTQYPLAIEATGLVGSFGETRAVDGVDLSVRTGSVYGVLGPNGAGKTTPVRTPPPCSIPDAGSGAGSGPRHRRGGRRGARAHEPHGSARLGGRGPDRAREPDPARTAARPEAVGRQGAPASCSRRSGSPTPRADSSSTTREECDGASTSRRASSSPLTSCSSASPTTGLDPRSRNQVWDIIRTLVGEGTTILLCTQYLTEADQLADGIAVIDHGKVIAEARPAS